MYAQWLRIFVIDYIKSKKYTFALYKTKFENRLTEDVMRDLGQTAKN